MTAQSLQRYIFFFTFATMKLIRGIYIICIAAALLGCRKRHEPAHPVPDKPEIEQPDTTKPEDEMPVQPEVTPQLEVGKSNVETDGDGGVFDILYMNNYEVEISTDDTWIKILSTSSTLKKLTFEVKRNTSDRSRCGSINLHLIDFPEIFRTITVTQGEKIPHPAIKFVEGGNITCSTAESFTLSPTLEDMTDHALAWTSDNTSVASVDSQGKVTIHSSGQCTITASNRHHDIQASIKLTVMLKAESVKIFFGDQEMDPNPIAIRYVGETFDIITATIPSQAYCEDLICLSTSSETAQIDGRKVSCLQPGRTTILVESAYQDLHCSYTLIVKE